MKGLFQCIGPEGFGNYEVNLNALEFKRVTRATQRVLIPGFVDIHVHGGFGIDAMSANATDYDVWCQHLSACGYEAFLPTTVTSSLEAVETFLENLPEHEMILGFHLEGPFISPKFPGAQPPSAIVEPPTGESGWDAVLNDPRLRVITMAPELPNALELITRLMKRGVIVSMGHTNATFEEARRGFEFGASHTTHTYNAMRPLHHREAGTVGYAFSTDGLACELIYDRKHVVEEAAAILLKAKPADKVIAVSDGTRAIGMAPGTRFTMWGLNCVVGRQEVRLEDGTLAGSAITLLDAFQNLWKDFSLETAIRLCCYNPRKALGLHGPPQVWVELDQEGNIVDRQKVSILN